MVSVETIATMQFAGTEEPLAYLELKSIGLPKTITSSASRALCDLVAGGNRRCHESHLHRIHRRATRHVGLEWRYLLIA